MVNDHAPILVLISKGDSEAKYNVEMNRTQISKIWLTDSAIWIEFNDGRKAEERFADYKRLSQANDEQRRNYVMSYFGIHWPEIDEDLSYDGFFAKHHNGIEASEKVR